MTQSLVKHLFHYKDGYLYWRVRYTSRINPTLLAGCMNLGYRYIRYNGKTYKASRLIFLYHWGYLPRFVDHKDGNRNNDLIDNLRPATAAQNSKNRNKYSQTFSKYKGVSNSYRKKKPWRASLVSDGRTINLGNYATEKEAAEQYNKAALFYHKEFANLNKME